MMILIVLGYRATCIFIMSMTVKKMGSYYVENLVISWLVQFSESIVS